MNTNRTPTVYVKDWTTGTAIALGKDEGDIIGWMVRLTLDARRVRGEVA